MGRPIAVKTKLLHTFFAVNERLIVENNKVVPPKSATWSNLYKDLPKNIVISTEKALYTAALKWWTKRQNSSETFDDSGDSCNNSTSVSSEIDSSLIDEQKRLIKFKIELSAKVWETIKPVTKIYSRKGEKGNGVRSYEVLKPGVWSNVILDHVTKKRRDITCEWVFQANKCYRNGVIFLKIKAKCKICCSFLSGIVEHEPEESEPVNINFELTALDLSRHEGVEKQNVKIGGEYAKQVYGTKKPASVIRRNLLGKKASLFVRPYGRVPTANAIRCGKYRNRQKEKLSTCPYDALSYLKASTKYMNTIHFIGKDPFSCIYASPDQIKLYKAYKKKNRYTEVSCDASAGVGNPLGKTFSLSLLGRTCKIKCFASFR